MSPRIVVIGLGPGNPELLTREAWSVLQSAGVLYLRTARHPLVPHLPAHLTLRALDEPTAAPDCAQLVDRLLQETAETLFYGVPGHPLVAEASTRLLLQRLGEDAVRIVAGLSFLEPVCSALGLDAPAGGLQLYDALELAAPTSPFDLPAPLDPIRPLLVANLGDRPTAAALQAALRAHYPAAHPLAVVQAAGVTGQEQVWRGPLHDLDRAAPVDHLATLYVPPLPRLRAQREAATLEWVCAWLRGPDGCPWDREQDHASLRNNLLEECYETLEALDQGDPARLCEELGDLLLQIYLHAQMAREAGAFTMADVVEGITAKLVRRHPHVFGSVLVEGSSEVLRNWEAIKAEERATGGREQSLLAGVPRSLPALSYAQAVCRRAARVGFDWERLAEVWAKVEEEMAELRQAATPAERSEELGDLFFALVNLARWLEVEAEESLRGTNGKFYRRFAYLEEQARQRGLTLQEMSLAEMDALWEEAKGLGV